MLQKKNEEEDGEEKEDNEQEEEKDKEKIDIYKKSSRFNMHYKACKNDIQLEIWSWLIPLLAEHAWYVDVSEMDESTGTNHSYIILIWQCCLRLPLWFQMNELPW